MQKKALSSEILFGDRSILIKTSPSSDNKASISSQVFSKDRLTDERVLKIADELDEKQLEQRVQIAHDEIVSEFKLWAEISEKVRQVGHATSCYKTGVVLLEKGFFEEAAAFLELTVSLDSEMAEAFHGLGAAHAALGQYDHAEKAYQAGLALAPGYADLIVRYAAMLAKNGQIDKALELLNLKLENDQGSAVLHYFLAVVLLRRIASATGDLKESDLQEIHRHFEQASRANGALFNEQSAKAAEKLEKKEFEEAADIYEKACTNMNGLWDATIDHEFYLKFMYGGMGKDNGFVEQYIGRLKNASAEAPDYADVHNNLGVAYLIMCRNLFLQALEEFSAALEINPEFKRAAKNLKLSENDGKGFLILLRALLK